MNSTHAKPRTRCCRDTEYGIILGVCSGIATYFDCPLWLIRLAALALAWLFPMPVVIVYLVAALLLPERALHYVGSGDERTFWQSGKQGAK